MSADTLYLPVIAMRENPLFPLQMIPVRVGRARSLAVIEGADSPAPFKIAVVLQKSPDVLTLSSMDEVHEIATLVSCIKIIPNPNANDYTVISSGEVRLRLLDLEIPEDASAPLMGHFEVIGPEFDKEAEYNEALFEALQEKTLQVLGDDPDAPEQEFERVRAVGSLSDLTDMLAPRFEDEDLLALYLEPNITERASRCLRILGERIARQELAGEINQSLQERSKSIQREYILRQQLKVIKDQLGEDISETEELLERIQEADMPEEVEAAVLKQHRRLDAMQPASSEYSVTLNYIQQMLDVPWGVESEDNLDVVRAEDVLDADHYGLEKVKRRVVEHLAVQALKQDMNGPILCFVGPPGVGKAQPLDARVLTPKGWVAMGTLAVGDAVMGADGGVHHVEGAFPQGTRPVYRVEFQDGSSTECCDEHLWYTHTDLDRKASREGSVKSLEQIRETLRYGSDARRNHSIPLTQPLEFAEKSVPLDPYLLGALLGDGGLTGASVGFSNPEGDICARVAAALPGEVRMRKQASETCDYRLTAGRKGSVRDALQVELDALELTGLYSYEKHVPYVYLYGSVEQRLALLQGLMDTGGTVDATGCRVSFCTTSTRLCDDVQWLVRSLGGVTRVTMKKPSYTVDGERRSGRLAYNVTVSMSAGQCPFWCDAKAQRWVSKSKYAPKRFISDIVAVGVKETQCIKVSAPDSLYITDDVIVTHNTSIAKSIARTMGRKFARISLGGMHDESEIRGHRRTYVGAMPGRIVRALQKAGTMNPVILLDEIDKVGSDFRGDPAAAFLEVLDPAQNSTFNDHYLEIDLDLSKVLFIATANRLDTISAPLRDRMEILEVPSYTMFEKNEIATRYLFPKQVAAHGLGPDQIEVADGVVHHVVDKYTREAGVRSLNRRLGDLCRSIAVDVVKLPEAERLGAVFPLDMGRVEKALGPVRYISEVSQREDQEGVATGLAWTAVGGDILFIEVQAMKGGKGEVTLTGQLGDVMKESVRAALSYLRAHGDLYGVDTNMIKSHDLHIHVPAGAIPKDGPSAGITMFSALLSRFAGLKLRREVAMTGEITLTGQVLPVGGIKEKVIAAHRAGIREVIMPSQCTKDLRDVDALVLSEMTFYPVDRVEQIPPLVFRDVLRDWTKALPVTEPFVQEPSV